MRHIVRATILTGITVLTAVAGAARFEMAAEVQAELDTQKSVVAAWATNLVIVNAVLKQNRKGPIAGIDNAKWKMPRRSAAMVRGFRTNPAGQFLRVKLTESQGTVSEAFLNAAHGEKAWQGPAEFDESSQTYAIQISVTVLAEGKPIGCWWSG